MKKFLLLCLLLLSALPVCAEDYDISGLWNIEGEGFVKDRKVEIKLNGQVDGTMNIYTALASEISQDLISRDLLSTDTKFLTGYDIHIRIDLTKLFKYTVWEKDIPNSIRVPVALPEISPSNNNPYNLASVHISNEEQDMNYSVILTSTTSGKIRINGIIKDVKNIGDVEVDSDNVIWLNGTEKPGIDNSVKSGCNFGFGIISLALIFLGVRKNVRN